MELTLNPDQVEFLQDIVKEKGISINQYVELLLWETIDDELTIREANIAYQKFLENPITFTQAEMDLRYGL